MSRLSLVRALFVMTVAAFAAPAHAADATTDPMPGGQTLELESGRELLIHSERSDAPDDLIPPKDAEEQRFYFNNAHCQCAAAKTGDDQLVGFNLRRTGGQLSPDRPVDIFAGSTCDDEETRASNCVKVASVESINQLDNPRTVSVPLVRVFSAKEDKCLGEQATKTLFLMVAPTEGGEQYTYYKSVPFELDAAPPPDYQRLDVKPSENAVTIEWEYPTNSDVSDVESYQALCFDWATGKREQAGEPEAPDYQTSKLLCAVDSEIAVEKASVASPAHKLDVSVATIPQPFASLDKAFICGSANKGARSLTIGGLVNGHQYAVALLSIDDSGNFRADYFDRTVTPVEVTDFWEDIQSDADYDVEGGFCLLADTYGDGSGLTRTLRDFRDETLASTVFGRWLTAAYYEHASGLGEVVHGSIILRVIAGALLLPVVAVALIWHALTLPGLFALILGVIAARRWRRIASSRSWRRLAAVSATLTIAVPAVASAQSFQPYWEEEEQALTDNASAEPRWHVGIKVGPYTPAIDAQYRDQTGSDRRPFKEAFEGGMWLPVLEVDRFVLTHIGQLGVGMSAGFTGDGARPWDAEMEAGPGRGRIDTDDMKFRMVPLTLTAVYRATQLDDLYGVPVVPYGRAGLAYTFWWANEPNGNRSVFGGPMDAPCEGRACRASGGSLGLVGSVGLAIRAEGIDKNAALSMREGGVEHAGFYAELQYGWVDGFGSEKKLAVGDFTWFAGVNFEF